MAQATIDEKVYPPYKVALLVEVAREDGIPAEETLRDSGLDAAVLTQPGARISQRQLLTVCENVLRLSKDPAVALRAGRGIHITAYGMYGYALLSSPSTRDAADFAMRYHKLATPMANMRLRAEHNDAAWIFESAFDLDPLSPLYRFIMEFQFAVFLSVNQDMFGADVKPLSVTAVYPAPVHADIYPKHLLCPVLFAQPANELRFDATLLAGRPNLANPVTAAMVRETCDRMLAEMQTTTGIASKVHGILLQHPGQFPDIEQVADKLYMVSRTLRRKLDAEGTSYKQILSDVRKQLALKYLRETRLGVEDIAISLGFSDASSFRQAFKRWTDKTPSDFRPT